MKFHRKTTLGRKLLACYLVFFAITFIGVSTVGQRYISDRVYSESTDTLWSVGVTLLSTHINQQRYTKKTILTLQSQLEIAAESAECRILIIGDNGDIVIDTKNVYPHYNVYHQGDSSFLRKSVWNHTTMNGYLDENSLCICLPMEKNAYLNGYMVLAQSTSHVNNRAIYYSNILSVFFYVMMLLMGITFIIIYLFAVRPLHRLRNNVIKFSIAHENPPIHVRSNDEYKELAQTLNVIGEELSTFDDYQRNFISNISHDFRSPLTNIRGYAQAMEDGIIPIDEQKKYLDIILSETERLTKLTTNLFDANSYDRHNMLLEITEFDIHKAIHNTCEALEVSAEKKGIRFELSSSNMEPLIVVADHDKILQVLHNLLDNAIKFSKNNSCVYINTRIHREKVFISVKDKGIGIPKNDLSQIWDRFYKTDLSRSKDKLGTGLGLSICREIINAHKQTIDVVSTVGVGSEFIFTLPRA